MPKIAELIRYGLVGAASTGLNIALYALFTRCFALHYLVSTPLAFALATVFAYFGNRYIVFHSDARSVAAEMVMFFVLRAGMGLLDFGVMYITIDLLRLNDLAMKIFSNVMVIAGNYLFSKFLIFRRAENHE
jgi:putative flippase GtrA